MIVMNKIMNHVILNLGMIIIVMKKIMIHVIMKLVMISIIIIIHFKNGIFGIENTLDFQVQNNI